MMGSNSCLKRIRGYKSHVQTSDGVLGAEAGLSRAKVLGHHFNGTLCLWKVRRERWSPDLLIHHHFKEKVCPGEIGGPAELTEDM